MDMVPWPVALLTLFYGVIAAASSATVWNILSGRAQASVAWPMAWLAMSGGAMCGLPLLKPWGRALAITVSILLTLVTMSIAGLLVAAHHPLAALAATGSSLMHVITIRYLQRPSVKAFFGEGSRVSTQQAAGSTQ